MRNPARDCVYCQEQAAKEVQRPFGKERELRGRERESRESKANSTMRGGNRDPFLSRREAAAVTVAGSVRQEQTWNVDDAGHAGVGRRHDRWLSVAWHLICVQCLCLATPAGAQCTDGATMPLSNPARSIVVHVVNISNRIPNNSSHNYIWQLPITALLALHAAIRRQWSIY